MDLLTIAAGTAAVGILAAAGIVISLLALPRLMGWQTDSLQVLAEKKDAELEYGSVRGVVLMGLLTFLIVSSLFMA